MVLATRNTCARGQLYIKQWLAVNPSPGIVGFPTRLSGWRHKHLLRVGGPALEFPQVQLEVAGLFRVPEGAAFQEAAEHDLGRLELIHVLEDEDLHLPRPQRHPGHAAGALLD